MRSSMGRAQRMRKASKTVPCSSPYEKQGELRKGSQLAPKKWLGNKQGGSSTPAAPAPSVCAAKLRWLSSTERRRVMANGRRKRPHGVTVRADFDTLPPVERLC
ncbi:hypothetical protein F2P81_002576 [Scophthalmus maximus]|uniref:Uncharacterized protein n=1 Tax=Scophthalmus maximus TaxID=52904 RepID=A0A6A4TH86_SCOMX|nr:hypothetical protein F2P81_002576 [Scophthalmus maximus]